METLCFAGTSSRCAAAEGMADHAQNSGCVLLAPHSGTCGSLLSASRSHWCSKDGNFLKKLEGIMTPQ